MLGPTGNPRTDNLFEVVSFLQHHEGVRFRVKAALMENDLVEAAGVEPASEKARREKNYVRFQFVIVGRRLRTGKKTAA